MTTVTLRDEVFARLQQLARDQHRDPQLLVEEAVERLLHDEDYRAAVREGIEQADRGQLIPFDDVKARLVAKLEALKDTLPR